MAESSKSADRPHILTLTLSLLAIAISIAGFLQSRQALQVSREVSRAVVQVSGARLTDAPERMSFLTLDLVVMNYGQVTAREVSTTFEWAISDLDVPLQEATYEQPPLSDLAPKSSKTARLQGNRLFSGGTGRGLNPGLEGLRSKLLVYGVLHYIDDLSGLRGSDPWCFVFDPHEKLQTSTLDLQPCSYRPRP